MARNTPESNRAAQAAHSKRLKAAGIVVTKVQLSPEVQRWLDDTRGPRTRSQALRDLLEHHQRLRLPIPKP